jgi:hypothetical protein
VIDRAGHHANKVRQVVLTLIGGVVWRGEAIEVKTFNGSMANVLWMTVNNHRYAFVYNHTIRSIEMRDRSLQGGVLHTFDNQTPLSDIFAMFDNL